MNQPEAKLKELTAEQSWSLLARKSVGRLAVSINNRPDIFPVNYRVDGGTIVIKTAAGLKLAAATLGTGVAFEVDDLDEIGHFGASVVVQGSAVEIENLDKLLEAEDLSIEPWVDGHKNRYIRIEPTQVTGRRISRGHHA